MLDVTAVTAVTVNWLTAARTRGAIDNFREFYPDIPVIVVDDASDPKHKAKFSKVYRGRYRNAAVEYDPDNGKLRGIDGVRYIQGSDLGMHPRSHGHCVDLAIEEIDTTWMYHFHSDYRLLEPGIVEFLLDGIDDTFAGAGSSKTKHKRCPAIENVAAVYNVKAGKEHGVTFRPVIYYDDGSADPLPARIDRDKQGGKLIEAGAYYTCKLLSLGYKVKWTPRVHTQFGVHLRWLEEEGGWNGPY
jgi:hypothetical protein